MHFVNNFLLIFKHKNKLLINLFLKFVNVCMSFDKKSWFFKFYIYVMCKISINISSSCCCFSCLLFIFIFWTKFENSKSKKFLFGNCEQRIVVKNIFIQRKFCYSNSWLQGKINSKLKLNNYSRQFFSNISQFQIDPTVVH